MLDAAGPISEALEQLNAATEGDSEEIELDLEKLGSTLEAALTFWATHQHKPQICGASS